MAKRSYHTSEVRGSDQEGQTAKAQEWPRGATSHPRSGAVARRSHPASQVRGDGQEELPQVQGAVATWAQEGLEELSHVKGQKGGR